jgi:hypothetical protein
LLQAYSKHHFLLTTAVHIVKFASIVDVLAFTAIECVSLRVFQPLVQTINGIVAIPAIDDVLAIVSGHIVVAIPP